jgi:hypothetical protein
MSEPGGASEVGHIIAYLSWNLAEWNRQNDQIRRDVNNLSRLSPDIRIQTNSAEVAAQLAALRRQADEVGRQRPNVHVQSNADRQTFQMHALRDSILLLGPAATPIGAVIAGSLAGAIPSVAALALGIGGIRDEMKSGALEGTQYGTTLHQIGGEFHTLKAIAAGGLLAGINKGWREAGPLVKTFNDDVEVMSQQLGNIVAGAAPGLLNIFTQLNPLFVTFGNELVKGANHLEHWSSSTTGIHSFVGYVQRELPAVEHTVGQLIELFVHLSEGLGPLGHVALTSLGVLAQLLNALPIDDLAKLETGALAVYFAFRTWSAINGIVRGVGTAVTALQAPFAARAAQATATAASIAAASAAEASAVEQAALAESEARLAAAQASLAAANTAARSGGMTALAARAQARAVEEGAAEQVAAQRAAAVGAAAAAEETAAASAAAATAVQANGERAAVGWAAALGPVGALAVGVGILATVFLGASHSEDAATAATDDYTESVKKSTNALSVANKQATVDALSKRGALVALDDLHSKNQALTVSSKDLTNAVNGSQKAYDNLHKTLYTKVNVTDSGTNNDVQVLLSSLKALRGELGNTIRAQLALEAAEKAQQALYDGGSAAAHRQAAALGATSSAYLAAQIAARKSAEQTRQQTVAWQLANDAANLLQQTLDKLNGKKQTYAQANNAFQQQLVGLQKQLKGGSKELRGLSEAAIANRGNLLQLIQGAEQTAGAYGTMTKSTEAGRAKLAELRTQIINNAVAQGANRVEVTKYVDSLLKIPKKVPPTKADVDKTAADAKIKTLQAQLDAVRQVAPVLVGADATQAQNTIRALQAQIDALHGKTIDINQQIHSRQEHKATGGQINGPGSGTSDSIPAMLSNGEEVVTAAANRKNHAALEAANRGATLAVAHFAKGGQAGVVTLNPTKSTSSSSSSSTGGSSSSTSKAAQAEAQRQAKLLSDAQAGITQIGQITAAQIALATAGAARIYAQLAAAGNRLGKDIDAGLDPKKAARLKAELGRLAASAVHQFAALRVHINTSDLNAFGRSIHGTVADAQAAFATLLNDARKLGISSSLAATLSAQNRTLDQKMNERASLVAQLGTRVRDSRTAYEKLNDAQQAQKDIAAGVKSATTGSFNIATSGTGYDGQQKITSGNIAADAAQRAAIAKKYVDGVIKLDKEGLNQTDVDRLAGEGPSAWPEVQALLAGGRSKLKSINNSEKSLAASGAKLGKYIGQQDEGAAVAAAQKNVTDLKKQIGVLTTSIGSIDRNIAREVRHALQGMHWEEQIDAAGIARVVLKGNKKLARQGASG